MDALSFPTQLASSHRNIFYTVHLIAERSGAWRWSYVIEDFQVISESAPVIDVVQASASAIAAASEHIDRILSSA